MNALSTQYQAVRANAGLFDASNNFGRIIARGKDVIDLLNRLSTNDLKPLEESNGHAVLTALLNEKGRFVDVLKVVRDSKGDILLITSKDTEEAVIQWLDKFTIMEDARFEPVTEKISQFEVIGFKATSTLSGHFVDSMDGVDVLEGNFDGAFATIWKESEARYTILTPKEYSQQAWNALEQAVLSNGGTIIDGELFEILRVESGTPTAPNEINEKHNPLELPIASEVISFTKGCYIGQEVIARLDAQDKVQRKLVGLKFNDGIPEVGDRISDETLIGTPLGDEIGDVTSIASSPEHGHIGLGYVRAKYANPGKVLSVKNMEGNSLPATIVELPFHA